MFANSLFGVVTVSILLLTGILVIVSGIFLVLSVTPLFKPNSLGFYEKILNRLYDLTGVYEFPRPAGLQAVFLGFMEIGIGLLLIRFLFR